MQFVPFFLGGLNSINDSFTCFQIDFVEELIKQAGIVAVPGCGFFHTKLPQDGYRKRYIRFAFCKNTRTLVAAVQRMSELLDSSGHLKLFGNGKDTDSSSTPLS